MGWFANALSCQLLAYFPGEDGRVVPLALDDFSDDLRGEESRSAASDGLRVDLSRLIKPAQNLTDAAIGHLLKAYMEQYFYIRSEG